MKKIIGFIRLEIESGKASPSPPVGPALGLRGVNIMQFCKDFNNTCRSAGIKDGIPIPTIITVFEDKTYVFKMNSPSVTYFLKNCTSIKKGASKPGKEHSGEVDIRIIYTLANIKQQAARGDLQGFCKSIIGSAKSMGLMIR